MLRKDFDDVLKRNIEFAGDDVKKGILLQVEFITDLNTEPVKALELWDLPREYKQYLDACIENLKQTWALRQDVNDDQLPFMKPYYGIAEHSAMLGGKVVYGGNTSYHEHMIDDYEDLDKLTLSTDNDNFKMLTDSLKYLKSKEKEVGFIASLRGGDSPLDIANAVRGNDIFYDFYEEEENLHKLLKICLKAARFTAKHQKDIIGQTAGGVVAGFGVWMPGDSIGHLSEDASSMCSLEMYKKYGAPYLKELIADYDCAFLHTHTMGRHILGEFAAMEKIKFVEMTYDPNQLVPIEVYKENAQLLEGKIVVAHLTLDELKENIEFLKERKTIVKLEFATKAQALQAVELVKNL